MSPTSRLSYLSEQGDPLSQPHEWTRGFVAIDCDPNNWQQPTLTRNGIELPIYVREFAGVAVVVADWPLSGAGHYELRLGWPDDLNTETAQCPVAPRKLSTTQVQGMVVDLQQRLPATIAIALQRAGALSGIDIVTPQDTTLAEELNRLERAISGTSSRAGLVTILRHLSDRPHQVLRAHEQWTDRHKARRIDGTRLMQAFSRPANVDEHLLPMLVPERPVEHSVDVYENRLLRAFHDQVNVRLRAVVRTLEKSGANASRDRARALLTDLVAARRSASFLDAVSELSEPPGRVTMVLLKRSEYRQALEGFVEFHRSALVQLNEPAIDAPLENLPFLYQTWGVLEIIAVALETASDLGFVVRRERLATRRSGQLWVELLRNGTPAAVLTHPATKASVTITPQKSYGGNVQGLHSMSFQQIPDLAVEIERADETHVYIFDPKYKLQSEETEGQQAAARPKKVDIDAMHAYRDAIRDTGGHRAVRYASILYPGPTKSFTPGLEALQALPGDASTLRSRALSILRPAIAAAADAVVESASQ